MLERIATLLLESFGVFDLEISARAFSLSGDLLNIPLDNLISYPVAQIAQATFFFTAVNLTRQVFF